MTKPGGRNLVRNGSPPSGGRLALKPRGDGPAPLVFHRGAHAPYATRWFGVTSLAGHARNFVASAIAAESIDGRDWMRPTSAAELLSHVVRVLGGNAQAPTLVEAIGRPLWIDFVADTGDDVDVSRAVARMVFREYSVEGAGPLPRGDVLLFGGDTAYPVATADEIARRLIAPYNEVLRERRAQDERPRVLLGIPGNHDWYDGLDGFGRLFRRSPHGKNETPESAPSATRRRRIRRRAGVVARQLHLDEAAGLFAMFRSTWSSLRALWSGTHVVRPRRLTLVGYEPVQDASYWVLPLAPGLEAWGVDRQLGRLDYRQRLYFGERRRAAESARILFVAPDPAIAFGERHDPGARMLGACKLSLERDRVFYLTGDMHHYERRVPSAGALHVIAGGGGAFLHGTRVAPWPKKSGPPARVWPLPETSRRLLAQVPLRLMIGSSGFVLHLGFAALAAIELSASARGTLPLVVVACVIAAGFAAALYANVGHNKAHPLAVGAVSLPFGAVIGFVPMALRLALPRIVPAFDWDIGVIVVYAFVGPLLMGMFLMMIARLGLEHQQAFSVLSHPGFKHFVRMCVHPDGKVQAWVIGKDDPLDDGEPTLVDSFEWT